MDFLRAGLLTGAVGDLLLQSAVSNGIFDAGLKQYFATQGSLQAILKASLLTGVWSGVYGSLVPSPSLGNFMVFGALLDALYRVAYPSLYPSLYSYYEWNPFYVTMAWNALVAFLVWEARSYV